MRVFDTRERLRDPSRGHEPSILFVQQQQRGPRRARRCGLLTELRQMLEHWSESLVERRRRREAAESWGRELTGSASRVCAAGSG